MELGDIRTNDKVLWCIALHGGRDLTDVLYSARVEAQTFGPKSMPASGEKFQRAVAQKSPYFHERSIKSIFIFFTTAELSVSRRRSESIAIIILDSNKKVSSTK